jgi:hypothetical protein
MRKRPRVIVLVLSAAACSSAPRSDPRPPPPAPTTRVEPTPGQIVTLPTGAEAVAARATLPFPPVAVWNVLPAAYEELGVKVEVVNSTAMRMGNEAFRTRRRIGSLPMVRLRLLACGGTIGAPNAETYDITLYVVSQL